MNEFIIVLLIIMSGLFSGLTIGLSTLSKDELKRLATQGSKEASKILEVTHDFNLMLVSLIFGNTITNVLLTDFLSSTFGSGIYTVMTATFLILIFGEISPAAILSKHALKFGAKAVPLIKLLILLFYPIAKPISSILNHLLGKDLKNIYTRDDFEYLLDKHTTDDSNIDELDNTMIKGTLSLNKIVVGSIISKRRDIFSLKYDTLIDIELIDIIKQNRYSKIPIINNNQVIGILKAKDLLNFDTSSKNINVMDLTNSNNILKVEDSESLDDVLEDMLEAKVHIASVNNSKNVWVGIITMEDILNKLFDKDIGEDTTIQK